MCLACLLACPVFAEQQKGVSFVLDELSNPLDSSCESGYVAWESYRGGELFDSGTCSVDSKSMLTVPAGGSVKGKRCDVPGLPWSGGPYTGKLKWCGAESTEFEYGSEVRLTIKSAETKKCSNEGEGCASSKCCGGLRCGGDRTCEPKLTLLLVPVDWEDPMDFKVVAERIRKNLLDVLPLKDCPAGLKIKTVDENCQVSLADNKMQCRVSNPKYIAQLKTCAASSGESYDYLVGLTADDTYCGAKGFATFNFVPLLGNTIMVADARGYTTAAVVAHELGHKWGLNDEYYDACRCDKILEINFPLTVGGKNCLDPELGGSNGCKDGNLVENSEYCAGGGKCALPTVVEEFCLGNKNDAGGRCIMSASADPGTLAFCSHCLEQLRENPDLTCEG